VFLIQTCYLDQKATGEYLTFEQLRRTISIILNMYTYDETNAS